MTYFRLKSGLTIVVLMLAISAHGQPTVAVGAYPFGSFSGGPFDQVNNANLNVQFSIPILRKAGATLPFTFSLGYNSSIWYPSSASGTTTWTPLNVQYLGWSGLAENVGTGGYVSYSEMQYSCLIYGTQYYYWWDYWNYVYHDSAGGSHPFNVATTTFSSPAPCGSDSNPHYAIGVATDNSGFIINTSASSVTSPQGIKFTVPFTNTAPSSSSASETNPNGDQISSNVSGGTTSYTDALGMTALTATTTGSPVTQVTYTYSAMNDVQEHVIVKSSQKPIQTSFGCTSPYVAEFTGTADLITEIDMADVATNPSDKYLFQYEFTPGSSTTYTGRLLKVTLPTGGTIQYSYSGGSHGIECSDGSTAGLTRTLFPGGAWTYTRTHVSGSEWKTVLSDPNSNLTTMIFQFATPSGAIAPLAYETERDLPGGAETVLTCYNGTPSPCTNASDTTSLSFPVTRRTVKSTIGTETSEVDTQYDTNGYGLPTDTTQYDWGTSGTPGTHLRETKIAYNYNTSCGVTNTAIVNRACTVQVNGNNNQGVWTTALSSTSNSYDANGNLLSTTSGGLTASATYNSNGTIAQSTDVNSQITTFAYNGTNGCSDAYPTSITGPAPSGLMVSLQWDCYAGVATVLTDPNSKQTTFGYDSLNRLARTNYPDGGSVTTTYSPNQIYTTTKVTSTVSRTDTTDLEEFGRVSSQTSAGAETDSTYDSLGRLSTVSVKNSGGQQDTYTYDALSRTTRITHADTTYSQLGYSNNCVTATDESNKVRKVCIDGLGRTSSVVEDPSSLNYSTTYAYDGLNDLIGVIQGAQQTCQIGSVWHSRCFQYDALSRMKEAISPESGTVTYTYDTDATCGTSKGDLVKRVDARSIRTCYAYDSLHRLASNTYSDTTPTANYYYDQSSYNGLTIANGKGRQTGMSDGSGETAWSFDPTGRIVSQKKTISGITKTLAYSYNYDGSVAGITYPSGRVITYGVDSSGRPATAEDTANGVNYVTGSCAGGVCYAPQNALASMINGKTATFGGVTYNIGYNNRLLPSSISASSTAGTALNLAYGYLSNANIETITNNRDTGRTVTYGYDALNRINSASSQATSGVDCWGQSVPSSGYDQFGNLKTITVSKCTAPALSLGIDTATNHITNTGFTYDSSGDETADGSSTYAWDAEGRMKSGAGVTYTFDGSGERVKDSSPELFWYGADGSVLAETDTSGNPVNEYIYFGGMRVARRDSGGNVYYYFGDALRSAAITTATGSVCYDADFYPFGGELAFSNTCAQNYKFAGMELDSSRELYRTIFRQYSSNLGRWLSADPLGMGAVSLDKPQTWNRYAYARNNPVLYTDPIGLDCAVQNDDGSVTIFPGDCDNQDPTQAQGTYIDASGVTGAWFDENGDLQGYGIGSQTFDPSGNSIDLPSFSLQGNGVGTYTYEGPSDVAYNGGFLIPLWPEPGLAGIAVGGQVTYIPKAHRLCFGPQVGLEALKQVSVGMLVSSKGEMTKIADGLGFNLSAITPWFVGAQVQFTADPNTKPAGGPLVGIPGASFSVSYSGCINVR